MQRCTKVHKFEKYLQVKSFNCVLWNCQLFERYRLPRSSVTPSRCSSFAINRETLNARASSDTTSLFDSFSPLRLRCSLFLFPSVSRGKLSRGFSVRGSAHERTRRWENHARDTDTHTLESCGRGSRIQGKLPSVVFTFAVRRYFKRSPHRHLPPPLLDSSLRTLLHHLPLTPSPDTLVGLPARPHQHALS